MDYLDSKEGWDRFVDDIKTSATIDPTSDVEERADYYFIEHPELVEKYAPGDLFISMMMEGHRWIRQENMLK